MFRALVDPDYASFNYTSLSAADGAEEAVITLNTFPVFDTLRVVVLFDVDGKLNAADAAAYGNYLAAPNPDAVFVVVCEDGAEKNSVWQDAEKVDCNRLAEDDIAVIVGGMLKEEPKRTMDRRAISELVTRTLSDMSRISCEVGKLKAYSDGAITREDVCVMTSAEPDYQIFQLSDAMGAGDKARALRVLSALLDDGLRPMTVINMLYAYYRRMYARGAPQRGARCAGGGALGGQARRALSCAQGFGRYTQVKLKKCVDYLHGLQYAVLTGRRGEESAMHDAVLTLMSQV